MALTALLRHFVIIDPRTVVHYIKEQNPEKAPKEVFTSEQMLTFEGSSESLHRKMSWIRITIAIWAITEWSRA